MDRSRRQVGDGSRRQAQALARRQPGGDLAAPVEPRATRAPARRVRGAPPLVGGLLQRRLRQGRTGQDRTGQDRTLLLRTVSSTFERVRSPLAAAAIPERPLRTSIRSTWRASALRWLPPPQPHPIPSHPIPSHPVRTGARPHLSAPDAPRLLRSAPPCGGSAPTVGRRGIRRARTEPVARQDAWQAPRGRQQAGQGGGASRRRAPHGAPRQRQDLHRTAGCRAHARPRPRDHPHTRAGNHSGACMHSTPVRAFVRDHVRDRVRVRMHSHVREGHRDCT